MKNKIFKIVLLLILGIFTVYPQFSYAKTCTDEDIDTAVKEKKQAARDAVTSFKSVAQKFNSAADQYIASCKTPESQQMYIPEAAIAAAAKVAGADYSDESIWKNTAYNWEREEAPSAKPNCASLLANVKSAKQAFDAAISPTETAINGARFAQERALCECNNEGGDSMCQEMTEQEGAQTTTSCKSFTEYQAELSACPLCPIFKVILRTIASVSSVAWHAVASPLTNVVKIFFLVLLAFEVLKAVSSVAGTKISSFLKSVLLLGFKVAITVLLLSTPKYIYGYFLSPVIEGGLNMGVNIANASNPGGHCTMSANEGVEIPSDTFAPTVYNSVLSAVRCFGQAASTMPAVGRGLTCNAWNDTTLGVPNISMWIAGAIMYVFGIMIWLAISFYMIDCTAQLGMLSGLVPLLIACWPFKLTESYTYKGCKMLMNSFFAYAMMGIVLLIGTEITTFSISGDGSDIKAIARAIDSNDIKALRKICDLGALQLLILGACAIFAMKLIGQTNDLADQFSKGAGSSIGNKLGGLATSAATNAAKGQAKLAGRVASTAGKYAAAETGVTAAFNKGVDKVKGGWQKGWAGAGKAVGLGKYQNTQTGSGKEGKGEGKEEKTEDTENKKPEDTQNPNPENPTTEPEDTGNNENPNPNQSES